MTEHVDWWNGPMVGFDLETTGVDQETVRIVTANLTYDDPSTGNRAVSNLLLDPGVEIPQESSNVHGITTEHARTHGMPAADGVRKLLELMNGYAHLPFAVFNGCFDFTILDREARRNGLTPFAPDTVLDALVMDKAIDRFRRGARTLTATTAVYGVTLMNAHSADADAFAAMEIARAIGRAGKVTSDLHELHAQQVAWRAEQSASFERYLIEKKGQADAHIERAWPLVPFPGQAVTAA